MLYNSTRLQNHNNNRKLFDACYKLFDNGIFIYISIWCIWGNDQFITKIFNTLVVFVFSEMTLSLSLSLCSLFIYSFDVRCVPDQTRTYFLIRLYLLFSTFIQFCGIILVVHFFSKTTFSCHLNDKQGPCTKILSSKISTPPKISVSLSTVNHSIHHSETCSPYNCHLRPNCLVLHLAI